MNYLDLTGPVLEIFRRRLLKKLDENESHSSLLQWLQTEPNVEKLVAHEQSRGRSAFATDCDYGDGVSGQDADIDEFTLPPQPDGSSGQGSASQDCHTHELAVIKKNKVFLCTASFQYSPHAVLAIYFGDSKKTGINKFPKT